MHKIIVVVAFFVCAFGQPTCSDWCTALYNTSYLANCPINVAGNNGPAFSDNTTTGCLAFCAVVGLPAGLTTDTSGNTLGCRVYHAGVAATIPGTYNPHCDHPTTQSANGLCGQWCENYCYTVMNGGCAGMYPSNATCASVCQSFPTTITGGSYVVNSNVPTNWQDNLPCRTYHGSLPSINGGQPAHCPHAWVTGGGACVSAGDSSGCAAYCRLMLQSCAGYTEVASDTQAACVSRCQAPGASLPKLLKFNFTDPAIQSGCSIDCRVYHIINAIYTGGYSTHCPHAYINAATGTPCYCAGGSPTTGSSGNVAGALIVLLVAAMLSLFI